jgi:hypothetical protein
MLNVKAFVLAVAIAAVPAAAQASWATTVEDDIFSGGKKAMMLGMVSSGSFVVADCESGGDLSLGYAEKGDWADGLQNLNFRLLVKIDGEAVREFDGKARQRNEQAWQVTADKPDEVLAAIRAIGGAQKQVLIGVQEPVTGTKFSGTARSAGSTRAVKQFLEACGL